mgnify:CR=1 FL=1
MLWRAKRNLKHKYACFGLQKCFEDSIEHIKRFLDWSEEQSIERRKKKTQTRPAVDELNSGTRETLEQSNVLDQELYRFACDLFEERIDQYRDPDQLT